MKVVIKQSDIQKRDPVAHSLASAQFRRRVVRDRSKYSRKTKHKAMEA